MFMETETLCAAVRLWKTTFNLLFSFYLFSNSLVQLFASIENLDFTAVGKSEYSNNARSCIESE